MGECLLKQKFAKGDVPETPVALIPKMTSDTSSVVSISGTGYYQSRYRWLAFDQDDSTSFHSSIYFPVDIILTFDTFYRFHYFDIFTNEGYSMNITLQGSVDGSTYVDMVANATYYNDTNVDIPNKNISYKYLKIHFTGGAYHHALLSEFQIYGVKAI